MLTLDDRLLRALAAHGEAAYPNEGAGLLLGRAEAGRKTVMDLLPVGNQWDAAEQYHRYMITPADMLRAETEAARRGLDVIGVFHSHPDHVAEPSVFDRDWALPWYSYIITSIRQARAVESRSWLLRDDRSGFDEEPVQVVAVSAGSAPASD
jgi:proteasome lid subunit RPN8/RPN11